MLKYLYEPTIYEASNYTDADVFLDILCASADNYNEAVIENIKKEVINVSDLWKQWIKAAKNFVTHKWIYRYINEKQKVQLQKHHDILCAENTNYSQYKKSFKYICNFMGLSTDDIILEDVVFKKDTKDKYQDIIAVKYSKGKIKVTIPDGIYLIHARAMDEKETMSELVPSFRSKTKGKYMYPSKRCFFTCVKPIENKKAGIQGTTKKFTPKDPIKVVYIDPSYIDFKTNSVYVETESNIPVEDYKGLLNRIFNK